MVSEPVSFLGFKLSTTFVMSVDIDTIGWKLKVKSVKICWGAGVPALWSCITGSKLDAN